MVVVKKREYQFQNIKELNVQEYNSIDGKSVFTTLPWIEFVKKDSHGEPVFIRITEGEVFIGYFTGLLVKKMGIKIMGSPFAGWSTCYMGIDTPYKDRKIEIYKQLVPFLFKQTGCLFIEIADRDVTNQELIDNSIKPYLEDTLELQINMDNDALFKQMKTDCRNFIRQFERRGARLEVAEPDDRFAEEYYHQLEDVFAKQRLTPTYSLQKVKTLVHTLAESGELLCLRVVSPEEKCIATSLFLGYGEKCFFWGGASYREDQHYRPNEYMIWYAIQYWREHGCKIFDMVGVRNYKKKFGSHEETYSKMIFAKYKVLIALRNLAQKMYYFSTGVMGRIKRKK